MTTQPTKEQKTVERLKKRNERLRDQLNEIQQGKTFAVRAQPRHARKPLEKLDKRSEHLLSLMVSGLDETERHFAEAAGVPLGQPLALEIAADIVGMRRRHARYIFSQRVFQTELNRAVEEMRSGAKPLAMQRVIDLVSIEGDGKAADRKVQLQAAQSILGDQVGPAPAKAATINISTGPTLVAGVVVRLPQSAKPSPLETPVIDHEPRATALRRDPSDMQERAVAVDDGD